jgi:hypothetical protein
MSSAPAPRSPTETAARGRSAWVATLLLCLVAPTAFGTAARAQAASPGERAFAERVAMRTIDERCRLLSPGARGAQGAFAAQARGSLLRAGVPDARVARVEAQAVAIARTKSCQDPAVTAEARRVDAAWRAWRGAGRVTYPGLVRDWTASRAGVDAWRAWQELGEGARAGLVAGGAAGPLFAVETPLAAVTGARLHLRDPRRLGPPKAGARLTPPLRAGAVAHVAGHRLAAITRKRVDDRPQPGTLFVFTPETTRAVVLADPRDAFEVEILGRDGVLARHVVEVGDLTAAYAFAVD